MKIESILFAYKNHGILIKEHARCCNQHIDSNGFIIVSEFIGMPTKCEWFDRDTIKLLDMALLNSDKVLYELEESSSIFDKFKNMTSLDENICFKVTGWTKEQFSNFAKHITSIRNTDGRTKEQLIAIYRFWLRKGIDQSTLALLKSNTSQQQISHYLAQIRSAIHEQFVPLYLGANKKKDFFLGHNTRSAKILHKMTDDQLVIIADGTYARLEKSANNDFQYVSYSMQKNQNLVKPFIVCCADGYIVDCYGPFQANQNDTHIFRHILKTDERLRKLLTPPESIIIFLDRGISTFNF